MAGTGGAPSAGRKINEQKWHQILEAAGETFAAKGYEATTIRDIAKAVGMLGGSLYYYIDTKEDLLYALIDDFHRVGMEGVAAAEAEAVAAGHAGDPLAVLRAVCARHAEINASSRTLSAVFYNNFGHLGDERKQHIVDSRRRHQHRIEELVEACQQAGEIRADIDPRVTALAMLSLLNATNTWYHPEKDHSARPIGEFLASILIEGLATRPASVPTRVGERAPQQSGRSGVKTKTRAKKAPASRARTTARPDAATVVPMTEPAHRKKRG